MTEIFKIEKCHRIWTIARSTWALLAAAISADHNAGNFLLAFSHPFLEEKVSV